MCIYVIIIFNHCILSLGDRKKLSKEVGTRASLVAQWLRIRLPMQGTLVQSLVWEDPACCRATKPVRHNY